MASTPSPSTPGSKYDVTSRISELLDQYFASMPPVSAPSAVFTSGPNTGLPVAAMPPSATPFRQKSAPRRVSNVTAETARARAERAGRPAKLAERTAKKAPKPPSLLARADQTASDPSQLYRESPMLGQRPRFSMPDRLRNPNSNYDPAEEFYRFYRNEPEMFPRGLTPEQLEKHILLQESRERLSKSDTSPPKQPRPGPRPAPYSTRTSKPAAPKVQPEARPTSRSRRPVAPSALSETLARINAAPASSIYQGAPGLTREDFRQASELIDIANTQKQMDIARALEQRRRADAEIANTQARYRQSDMDFANRLAELDKDAIAKQLAAQQAARRAASAFGVARESADAMGRYVPFDPLASFGRMIGFGQ